MGRKFVKRYLKPTAFNPKGSLFNGLVWSVPSSRGDSSYSVTLHDVGFECDCPGFGYHGYCKHSKSVLKRVEEAVEGRVPHYKMEI